MFSSRAAACALVKSREAMAAMSLKAPFCIPGMTLRVAMDATPRTPHLIFLVIAFSYRDAFSEEREALEVGRRTKSGNSSIFHETPCHPSALLPVRGRSNHVKGVSYYAYVPGSYQPLRDFVAYTRRSRQRGKDHSRRSRRVCCHR